MLAPRRLPSLKAQMIEEYESPVGRRYCMGFMESVNTSPYRGVTVSVEQMYEMPRDGGDLNMRLARGMRVAENFHVSSDIVDFIGQAGLTLPLDEAFSNFDLPSTHGFIFLDNPLRVPDVRGKIVTTRILVWNTQLGEMATAVHMPEDRNPLDPIDESLVRIRTNVPGVNVIFYHTELDRNDHDDYSDDIGAIQTREVTPLVAHMWGSTFIPFGENSFTESLALSADGQYVPANEVGIVTIDRWMRTFWKFVRDELPALDMRREESPKSDRRYLRRMRMTDNVTTVITLRKRMHGPDGHGSFEYSHRFIVRGHWAKRWCGPGRKELRYVYINPYLKGPEGAPLLAGREHVHHVAR